MKCSYADRCDYPTETTREVDGPAHVVVLDIHSFAEEVWHEKCHAAVGCEVCIHTQVARETW